VASVITPVLLGMAVGAVSAGSLRLRDGQVWVEELTPERHLGAAQCRPGQL